MEGTASGSISVRYYVTVVQLRFSWHTLSYQDPKLSFPQVSTLRASVMLFLFDFQSVIQRRIQRRMINECGTVGRIKTGIGDRSGTSRPQSGPLGSIRTVIQVPLMSVHWFKNSNVTHAYTCTAELLSICSFLNDCADSLRNWSDILTSLHSVTCCVHAV